MGLSDVSNVLWRERQLMELLLFKLEEEQLVLAAGRDRWLSHATREVETVLAEIKRVELDRAVAVDSVASELGLGPSPSLQALAEHATGPWARIFTEHRNALLELAAEIDTMAQSNRELLSRGHRAAEEALIALGDVDGTTETYSPKGFDRDVKGRSGLLNEAM